MKTFLRTLSLAVASAVTAEFLLGDQYLGGMAPASQQIPQLILFTAFYGSAAVLIRELGRRAGVGWPGILTLALAFGVLEEGIATQSLFNPDYVGQHLLAYGYIPLLGTGGPWLILVLTLHVVWSIGSPIAVMEGAFGEQPWVRHAGWLAVPAVLYVLGGAAIFVVSWWSGGFMASGWQLGVSALVALALVILTFTVLRGRASTEQQRPRAGFVVSLVAGLVLSAAFQLAFDLLQTLSPWVTVAAMIVVLGAGILFAFRARPDALGFASGAILTYCGVGILLHAIPTGPAAVVEQVVIVLITLGVLAVICVRRLRERAASSRDESLLLRTWPGKAARDRLAR
ncbi:hypothetical protein GCM10027568_24480 [Humibacter soli]